MARSDLLKKLFRSFKARNDGGFLDAAREIAEEERKKHHHTLADELLHILDNGTNGNLNGTRHLEPLPKDNDRGSPLLEVTQPDRYFADLILPTSHSELFRRILLEWREWDVLEANGLRAITKLLFCGPPGCGKTVTAQAMSSELGFPLVTIRFDAVVSSLLGETAANLRKVFDFINRGSWVVLFDEFDAIGRSRDDPTEHSELKRVVNSFLQMLDRFHSRSLVIAATNFEQSLDPSLWRRFDEIVRFDLPTPPQIRSLLECKLKHVRIPKDLIERSFERLYPCSHAEVERVCLDILKTVALRGQKTVFENDIEEAIRRQELRKQTLNRSRSTTGEAKVDEK